MAAPMQILKACIYLQTNPPLSPNKYIKETAKIFSRSNSHSCQSKIFELVNHFFKFKCKPQVQTSSSNLKFKPQVQTSSSCQVQCQVVEVSSRKLGEKLNKSK